MLVRKSLLIKFHPFGQSGWVLTLDDSNEKQLGLESTSTASLVKAGELGIRTEPENIPCGGHNVKKQKTLGGQCKLRYKFSKNTGVFLKNLGHHGLPLPCPGSVHGWETSTPWYLY